MQIDNFNNLYSKTLNEIVLPKAMDFNDLAVIISKDLITTSNCWAVFFPRALDSCRPFEGHFVTWMKKRPGPRLK